MIADVFDFSAITPIEKLRRYRFNFASLVGVKAVAFLSMVLAVAASAYSYQHGIIVAYGDAESHLNIAKRVVDSLTPGAAQLGGIWLPLPHMLLLPFVKFDFLWRTGLAGSIVSGAAFVVSATYIYKLALLLTKKAEAGMLAALVFMLNPNLLYLQSTPMTELTLIVFFVLSSYYFILYIKNPAAYKNLILAAFFGLCASLSRYDGWFLVSIEAGIVLLLNLPIKFSDLRLKWDTQIWQRLQGYVLLFVTLAFFGILFWLLWGYLILGDPLYFTHSQYSAKSQQVGWLARGMLPAYKHIGVSVIYYLVTALENAGVWVFAIALLGFLVFLFYKPSRQKWLIALLLNTAFIFYVATLYIGQSVIFIRPLTPSSFDWILFNVRYGVMMLPAVAVFFAYLYSKANYALLRILLIAVLVIQTALFLTGKTKAISMEDGVSGLSAEKNPEAQTWIAQHYDGGLVLMDDYARTVSVVKSGIPMQNMIYVGNRPYWEQSLQQPQKYATWIIIQKDDSVWKDLIDDPGRQGLLYTYFQKVYTSPSILIFRRNTLSQT